MPRITSAKLIAVGTTVALIAAAVGVAIWQSDPRHFSHLPAFWVAVAAFVIGAVALFIGLIKRDVSDAPPHLIQRAGDRSEQYQAGRDLHVRRRGDRKP